MRKGLIALIIATSSVLYNGCSRDYKEYNIDGNKVLYSKEKEQPFTLSLWDIIETKKDSTIIKYNFINERGLKEPSFEVRNTYYDFSPQDSVSVALNNRLHYLTHKIDSTDKADERNLIKKINK